MNDLNLEKKLEQNNKKIKTPLTLKQSLLKLILFFAPVILILTLILTAVFVMRDGYYLSQINDIKSIWHNSANNVTEIKQRHPDFSGWVNSDDGKFDFPIFSADYKNCSFYIDEKCDPESSKNLILHTPEKANRDISASVLSFKDINFFNRHPSLEVNTDYDKGTYIAFASFYSNTTDFDAYNFHTLEKEAFKDSIESLAKSNFLKTNFDINNDDDFLTIILKDEEEEFVVIARKLRKGEEIVFSNDSTKK